MAAVSIGITPADPQLAMQMQQMQQMQHTLQHSQRLAAQVAQLRAVQRTGGIIREDPLKAAEEAAARLTRKFAAGAGPGVRSLAGHHGSRMTHAHAMQRQVFLSM